MVVTADVDWNRILYFFLISSNNFIHLFIYLLLYHAWETLEFLQACFLHFFLNCSAYMLLFQGLISDGKVEWNFERVLPFGELNLQPFWICFMKQHYPFISKSYNAFFSPCSVLELYSAFSSEFTIWNKAKENIEYPWHMLNTVKAGHLWYMSLAVLSGLIQVVYFLW